MGDIRTVDCPYFDDEELKIIYDNRQFLETYMLSFELAQILHTVAGEKQAYYRAKAVAIPIPEKEQEDVHPMKRKERQFNLDDIEKFKDILDTLDVTHIHRIDYEEDELENHRGGYLNTLITTDEDLITEEDREQFNKGELSHSRFGEILGYPESSVDFFDRNEYVSREEKADLFYRAVKEMWEEDNPNIARQEELPIIYLRGMFRPAASMSRDVEDYKWSLNQYLELLDFSRTMSKIFDSDHIKNWGNLNRYQSYKISDLHIDNTKVIDNFKKLQEEFVVNNGKSR